MKEILNDSAWKKTFELIKGKYGKNLSYRSIRLTNTVDSPFYSQGDDLIIPLKIKDHDLGDVVVNRGSLLDSQQKTEVVDLIKFLIEPKVYNLHLQNLEQNSNASKAISNIPFIGVVENDSFVRTTLSSIIHLKSHSQQTRHKVAMKIHEMSERNLFVFLDDIAATLTSVEDIKTLNDMTVYVDNIENLSSSMLTLLQKYLSLSYDSGPLFLIGSTLSLQDLESRDLPELVKKDLMGFYFDIDRVPVSQQTSEEILELLFFQLDGFST